MPTKKNPFAKGKAADKGKDMKGKKKAFVPFKKK